MWYTKTAKAIEIDSVEIGSPPVGAVRRFEDHGDVVPSPIVHEMSESRLADFPFADVFVAVDPACEFTLGIVHVDAANVCQADGTVHFVHQRRVSGGLAKVVAGRAEMTGVETDAQSLGFFRLGDDVGVLPETIADRRALPGGRLPPTAAATR